MKNTIRKTAAAIIALTLVCGGLPTRTGGFALSKPSVTANAAETSEPTVSFDEETGVLTLSGNVDPKEIQKYAGNAKVKTVVAEGGTVFPYNSSGLFRGFLAETMDLSKADTGYAYDMSEMFENCKNLTSLDLSGFDTIGVEQMDSMFAGCEKLASLDLSCFRTYDLNNMNCMFSGCKNLTSIDLSNFYTVNVESMGGLFKNCEKLESIDLKGVNTSNTRDMSGMFYNCTSLKTVDLSEFNTSNVYYMSEMFCNCSAMKTVDLSGFETPNLGNINAMFKNCSELKTVYVSDGWTINAIKDFFSYASGAFEGCINIVGGNGTVYDKERTESSLISSIDEKGNVSWKFIPATSSGQLASIDKEGEPGYFTFKERKNASTVSFDEETGVLTLSGNVNKNELLNYKGNVRNYKSNEKIKSIVAEEGTVLPADCSAMFLFFNYVTSIDLSKADTSNVTDMNYMFSHCQKVKLIDLTGFNTSNVTDMNSMFAGCSELTSLDLTEFDTSNVTDMSSMFRYTAITSLDLSGFDTSKVTDMSCMFKECWIDSLDISGFDTSNVTDMTEMFKDCRNLESLDLSSFDTSKVEKMREMFCFCSRINAIYVGRNWTTVAVKDDKDMFLGCDYLYGENDTGYYYNSDKVTSEYARIDEEGKPGYFTEKNVSGIPSAQFDEDTGVLTLKGNVFRYELNNYRNNENVKTIVAAEGTVLPVNCKYLFNLFHASAIDLSKADTSNVVDMSYMFSECGNLVSLDLSGLDTSNVSNMRGIFMFCVNLPSLDLSSLDTSKVTNMKEMFCECDGLQTVYVGSGWTTSAVTVDEDMFESCYYLYGGNGTEYDSDKISSEYARIDKNGEPGYFSVKFSYDNMTGDVNGDGQISKADGMLLSRYIAGWEGIKLDLSVADINKDGSLTVADRMILSRYLAGWDGYDHFFN